MTADQTRVFLWAAPRCLSSAFFRAINNVPGTKGFFEPYANAYYFGSERVSTRYSKEPVTDGMTYSDIKAQLEQPYSDSKVVFAKDVAYAFFGCHSNPQEMLPSGYTHTFLIRDPQKSLTSLFKIVTRPELTGWDFFDAKEAGFKELYELYILVTEKLGQRSIVLDADDLLSNPEPVLKNYCNLSGLNYHRTMLHWDEATPDKLDPFKDWPKGWFQVMLASNTFNKPTKMTTTDVTKLPQDVQDCIKESIPYYEKLYQHRIRI